MFVLESYPSIFRASTILREGIGQRAKVIGENYNLIVILNDNIK
jgi:hypothetical protein